MQVSECVLVCELAEDAAEEHVADEVDLVLFWGGVIVRPSTARLLPSMQQSLQQRKIPHAHLTHYIMSNDVSITVESLK